MTGLDVLDAVEDLLVKIADAMPAVVADLAEEHADLMADMNREQLKEGIRSDGSKISPPYTPFTIRMKQKKGQPTTKVTLFDEGNFHAALKGKKQADGILLESDDWKREQLKEKYGNKIEGLTDENLEKLRIMLYPRILFELRKRFF